MWHSILRMFRKVSPAEIAARDLYDAELSLLQAHKHREYALALVTENEARVQRLRKYLATLRED